MKTGHSRGAQLSFGAIQDASPTKGIALSRAIVEGSDAEGSSCGLDTRDQIQKTWCEIMDLRSEILDSRGRSLLTLG